jgi:hypothetical protein
MESKRYHRRRGEEDRKRKDEDSSPNHSETYRHLSFRSVTGEENTALNEKQGRRRFVRQEW